MKHTLVSCIACLALIAMMVPARAASGSIVEACTRTVNDYAWALDHPGDDIVASGDAFARLFTEGASLTVHDDDLTERTHTGAEAIAAYYRDNRNHTRFLHITSNIRIIPMSDGRAKGTSYMPFFAHADTGSMKDEGAITGLLENRDVYELTDKGCLIAERISTLRYLNLFGVINAPGSP